MPTEGEAEVETSHEERDKADKTDKDKIPYFQAFIRQNFYYFFF